MPDIDAIQLDKDIAVKLSAVAAQINHPFLRSLSPSQRIMWGQVLAEAVGSQITMQPPCEEALRVKSELVANGVSLFGQILSPSEATEAREYFLECPVYNSHVYEPFNFASTFADHHPRVIGHGAEAFRFGAHAYETIITAPHIMKFVTAPQVVDAAAAFLGGQPTLYSVNAWWSFPGHPEAERYGQSIHRDMDLGHFCAAFMYLTDVDEDGGPHQYLNGSHTVQGTERIVKGRVPNLGAEDFFRFPNDGNGFDSMYTWLWKDNITVLTGPAGTAFMGDTYGLHRGIPPRARPRLAVWARYGLFAEPPRHAKVDRSRLGDTYPDAPHLRYMLRGLVNDG